MSTEIINIIKKSLAKSRKAILNDINSYFRYLSRASYISITIISDIYQLQIRYHKKLQPLSLYIITLKRDLTR